MAEKYNYYQLLNYSLNQLEAGKVVPTHPTFDSPNSLTDPVSLSLSLNIENITPTGLRTLAFPYGPNGTSRLVVKGYFPSPVHIYGDRPKENLDKWLHHFQKQGEFGGRATEDDVLFEYSILEKLRKTNPEIIADPAVPIWQLIGIGNTGEEVNIWREDDKRPRKRIIIFRRFPFTHWRVTDPFMMDDSTQVENELNRLQSLWNVSDRNGVYIRAGKRLAHALGYLYNADVVHGNLYWRWYDSTLKRTYARPNPHNVAFDGSIGDFEIPDEKYGVNESEIHIRETLGAFSIYSLLIAKNNPELLGNGEFVARFISEFLQNLPSQLRQQLRNSTEVQQVIKDFEGRLDLSKDGKKTMSGMECFDDAFFASSGHLIIHLLEKLTN